VLGGEILVESTPGVGSVFRVRMLLSEVAGGGGSKKPERRVMGYAGARRKILVVDDDADHVELLSDFLDPLGFVIRTACNGQEAMRAAEDGVLDFVILDIAMPGTSGLDVAAALRGRFPDIKILIVSGNFHDASRIARAPAAHDAFLSKPIDIRALLEQIRVLLGLSWVYETPVPVVTAFAPASGRGVPERHLEDLLRLGRIGYVRGIEAKLDEIDAAAPEFAEFTGYLRELVGGFELRKIVQYLERLSEAEA